jgi:ABC-type phosphate transport system auxiliary subunit
VRPDDSERDDQVAELERRLNRVESRLRLVEARLQDRAVTLSDKKGKTRRLRLGTDDALEVE